MFAAKTNTFLSWRYPRIARHHSKQKATVAWGTRADHRVGETPTMSLAVMTTSSPW
jgi:hypothetical protein